MRIELGELEAQLAAHAGVELAVATTHQDAMGNASLVAYVVPRAGASDAVNVESLRDYLRQRLPDHLVPSSLMMLDSLPTTGSGKIDYRALPAPRAAERTSAPVLPATELESAIAAIWRDVLELDVVGTADNFFDVGGHSLRLVAVHERLQQTLGRELPIVDLFRYPTIASLASRLSIADTAEDTVVSGARDRAARQRSARSRPARQS